MIMWWLTLNSRCFSLTLHGLAMYPLHNYVVADSKFETQQCILSYDYVVADSKFETQQCVPFEHGVS